MLETIEMDRAISEAEAEYVADGEEAGSMERKIKICLIVQLALAVLFAVLLIMNILGHWSYAEVRYYFYAIVILVALNTIIGLYPGKSAGRDGQG